MNHRDKPSEPVRILFCEGNIDGTIGGSYFSLLFLVAGLDRSRFEPIVVFRCSNSLISRYNESGIRTLVIPKPKPTVLAISDGTKMPVVRIVNLLLRAIQRLINFTRFLPIDAIRCARLLRNEHIDIVHLNNSVIRNHEWMLASLLARTRCITHERGINASYSGLSRFLASRIDGVISISQAVQDSLDKGGVRPRTSKIIYNGINPDEMEVTTSKEEIRLRHGIPLNARLIGVLGNIKPWKGQETAVRALPAVLSSHPDIYCLLVGDVAEGDRPYFQKLEKLAASFGVSDRVIFTGYTSDVAGYMSALDVVLHTSIDPEPFGRVLIEAMSLKKPLVGAAAGAVPEIIDEGKTGLLFLPGDAEDLAACIIRLLDTFEDAKLMGTAGLDRLNRLFHIDVNVTKTQDYYSEIL